MKGAIIITVAVALLAWPVFIVVSTALSALSGEAWQLDAWAQEPRRRLLAVFLEGWVRAAPWALGIGLLAALDHRLMTRFRILAPFAGISLPLAGAALAFVVWPVPMDALPTLAATGLALAMLYRLTDLLGRAFR